MEIDNPLRTAEGERFVVGTSEFAGLGACFHRCEVAAIVLCRSGRAEALVDQSRGSVTPGTLLILLPGAMFMLTDRSEHFRADYCVFSRELFAEASFRLEPAFFRTLREHPISHPAPSRVEGMRVWFRMAEYTYSDRENMFRNTIIRNRLQNVMLEIYDKYLRRAGHSEREESVASNRQTELFHRFVTLVQEEYRRHREVGYYADRLCVSARYLSTIVRHVAHCSVKEFIDRAVVLEIKMLLQTTDLSVQEIAYRLHFPDQSYLGRYFKKHTGRTPIEYRNDDR